MPGFANVRAYNDALINGRTVFASFRKVPSQASSAGQWVDLSMAAGSPVPNYFASAPLVAATLDPYRGMFHGADQSPRGKFLAELSVITPTASLVGRFKLLDYLLYYPFVDLDDLDAQIFDNTVALPRFADGDGVMAMAVAVAPTIGGGFFTFEYVNQKGETRTSPTQICGTSVANIASLVTPLPATVSGVGPFLTLSQGDTGIRRINSVQMLAQNGGLMAIVLVRPIVDIAIREINTQAEISAVHLLPGAPPIEHGYLNMICNPAGSVAAGVLTGHMRVAWN